MPGCRLGSYVSVGFAAAGDGIGSLAGHARQCGRPNAAWLATVILRWAARAGGYEIAALGTAWPIALGTGSKAMAGLMAPSAEHEGQGSVIALLVLYLI